MQHTNFFQVLCKIDKNFVCWKWTYADYIFLWKDRIALISKFYSNSHDNTIKNLGLRSNRLSYFIICFRCQIISNGIFFGTN